LSTGTVGAVEAFDDPGMSITFSEIPHQNVRARVQLRWVGPAGGSAVPSGFDVRKASLGVTVLVKGKA